jgi:hypothetical protein
MPMCLPPDCRLPPCVCVSVASQTFCRHSVSTPCRARLCHRRRAPPLSLTCCRAASALACPRFEAARSRRRSRLPPLVAPRPLALEPPQPLALAVAPVLAPDMATAPAAALPRLHRGRATAARAPPASCRSSLPCGAATRTPSRWTAAAVCGRGAATRTARPSRASRSMSSCRVWCRWRTVCPREIGTLPLSLQRVEVPNVVPMLFCRCR